MSKLRTSVVAIALAVSLATFSRASSISSPSSGVAPAGCKLVLTSNQSLPNNASTAISWQAGSASAPGWDTTTFFVFATDPTRLTCATAVSGKYVASGGILFAADALGTRTVEIDHYNASNVVQDLIYASSQTVTLAGNGVEVNAVGAFNMAAGDYVIMIGSIGSASGAVNATASLGRTFLTISRVGN